MKECEAYDNLPAKQSRWEISLHNARDLLLDERPSDNPAAISRASASPGYRQHPHLFQVNAALIDDRLDSVHHHRRNGFGRDSGT
jgi:hypothetical protein